MKNSIKFDAAFHQLLMLENTGFFVFSIKTPDELIHQAFSHTGGKHKLGSWHGTCIIKQVNREGYCEQGNKPY